MAALAYPFWFVIFPLVYMTPDKRNDPFLRFHTYQAATLGMLGVVGMSVLRAILSLVVRWFIIFDVLLYPALKVGEYAVLAMAVYGAIGAFQGRCPKLPYISSFVSSLTPKSSGVVEDNE